MTHTQRDTAQKKKNLEHQSSAASAFSREDLASRTRQSTCKKEDKTSENHSSEPRILPAPGATKRTKRKKERQARHRPISGIAAQRRPTIACTERGTPPPTTVTFHVSTASRWTACFAGKGRPTNSSRTHRVPRECGCTLAGTERAYHQSIAINSGRGRHSRHRHLPQSGRRRHSVHRRRRHPKSPQRATPARMAPAAQLQ